MKRIGVASDHAGFELKLRLIDYMEGMGYSVEDFGAYTSESSDYPDFAHLLADAVENGAADIGVSLCGSGNGINMTVNKHRGIRSALCWNEEAARLARSHNDANICALPARFIDEVMAKRIVDIFLITDFEGGRHAVRVKKIVKQ